MAQQEAPWFAEAKSLSEQLRAIYTRARFRHLSLLESPSDLPSDHLLGCELALTAKCVSSPVQEPLTLPEVLVNLNSVMSVEGEAGSGKMVLLKKDHLSLGVGVLSPAEQVPAGLLSVPGFHHPRPRAGPCHL